MGGYGVEFAGGHGEEAGEGEAVVGTWGGVQKGDGAGGYVVVVGVVARFAGAAGERGGEGKGGEKGDAEEGGRMHLWAGR